MTNIFEKYTVIELASVLAGPSVGQFFAELGARVIKVENTDAGGDVTRSWKVDSEKKVGNVSAYFSSVNWGKHFISLNLKQKNDLLRFYEIVQSADIIISSFKTGDDIKLKVDYKTISEIKPSIIYGHITGYGPKNSKAGYDAIIQAEAGFMYMNGEPNSTPLKMPVALVDVLTAHQLKEGILCSLLIREKTGKGNYVEVNLFQSAVSSLVNQATNYLQAKHSAVQMGSEHPNIVPYGKVFYDIDNKPIVFAIGNDNQFKLLCQILSIPLQENIMTNELRVTNRNYVNELIAKKVVMFHRAEIIKKCYERHIPVGAVHSIPEVFEQPLAKEMILEHDDLKGLRSISFELDNGFKKNELLPPK